MAKGLTGRQRRFIEEYVIDHNGAQAAIRAGYSKNGANVTGAQLLANPNISAAVTSLDAKITEKAGISAAWVLEKLQENHDRAMQAMPVLKFDHATKEMVETGEYVYDGAVANRSLELIGKHLAMFTENVRHEGTGGGPLELIVKRSVVR